MQNKNSTFIFVVVIITVIGIFILLQARYKNYSPTNVMIIVIDALRPDHLGCYGYQRDTSPNIDRLARQGIKFTQAISAAGYTTGSVPSILTGTYPLTHQIQTQNSLRNPSIRTLPQVLNPKGYKCVFWSNLGSIEYLDIKDGFQELHIENMFKEDNMPLITDS